ncbi:hypothetical protein IPN35_00565 [Candidatus Peregrinibacteria bacterium]|nr:MAG: hypothetical protein IPN35_00565 [Candidatus Peregrinibacteria bacterium]
MSKDNFKKILEKVMESISLSDEKNITLGLNDERKKVEKEKTIIESLEKEKQKKEQEIRHQERKDVLDMRKIWSIWLLRLIWLIALFDMGIVLGYGFQYLTFDNESFVAIIIGENLLKIAGLAFIVVKFLFNGKSTK